MKKQLMRYIAAKPTTINGRSRKTGDEFVTDAITARSLQLEKIAIPVAHSQHYQTAELRAEVEPLILPVILQPPPVAKRAYKKRGSVARGTYQRKA